MPARIVMVHDEVEFLGPAGSALRASGHDVATFEDPMAALSVLEGRHNVELLITGVIFALGKLNGLTLALIARHMKPPAPPTRAEMKILFIARAEYRKYTAGVGEFLDAPVSIPDLVAAVDALMQQTG
jgi:DNA-binding NtrC family response regulator